MYFDRLREAAHLEMWIMFGNPVFYNVITNGLALFHFIFCQGRGITEESGCHLNKTHFTIIVGLQ